MDLKFAVVDDNEIDREYVSTLVKNWAENRNKNVKLVPFPSAEAFLFAYEDDKEWNFLLLDIEMAEMNGVDLAKTIRRENESVQMVFIRGFPDFIAEGYDVSALHYLMKPVSPEKLECVLDKGNAALQKSEKQLLVTFDRNTELVLLRNINYIEAQKQYVLIHTQNGEYRMKTSLGDVEEQLDEYFFKCQRSFIVNLREVLCIKPDHVILKNGEQVPISRGMAQTIGKEIIKLF
ncbi:MAG: response regulator transcription factor [Ruminococcaceae bacterium]|nr:response regulator transcription factor [Oscillospiraceae bacterium]